VKFSTKTRYGTRALVDLAIHQQGNIPIPLKEIAERQEISLPYLEHIIAPLVSSGLISSVRGTRGGITLAKSARNITLKEVVNALEGSVNPVECIASPQSCHRSVNCATREIWDDVKKAIDSVLVSTTLQDLVDRQNSKESITEMYYI
jgi:Rrf2 family transcriptional regulator, cysteine metabolism repressor